VTDGWCWFVLREEYCWLVAGGWFVMREKYCWLVADKLSEQGASFCENCHLSDRYLQRKRGIQRSKAGLTSCEFSGGCRAGCRSVLD
jgi:hypothetical protein